MPSVTVVIASFNRAESLLRAVTSVLRQTHPPLEVLVVDDGSTDHTPEVCEDFPEPVRCIRQANGGVSAARNRGIREARGEWIALLDSDDRWTATKLEVQFAALADDPASRWSISGCEVIDERDRALPTPQSFERVFGLFREMRETPYDFFARALSRSEVETADERHTVFRGDAFELFFHGNIALPSSALVQRTLIEEAGMFDPEFRLAEETEFFHRLAARSPVALVTSPLVRYQTSGTDSLTSSSNTATLATNALRSLQRAATLRTPLSASERRAYETGRQRLMLRLAYAQLSALEPAAARASIARGWREGLPRSPRSVGIYAAGLLPAAVLRRLHTLKRRVQAVRR